MDTTGKTMDDQPEIDWSVGAELIGASKLQVKFVQGLVAGLSKTAAARAAGYKGEGAALRGHASRCAKSDKVRALLSWAQAGGAGPSDVPGDLEELKKILWKHARGADKTHSIRATEVLHKLAAQERQAEYELPPQSAEVILADIVKLLPAIKAQFATQWSDLIASLSPAEGAAFAHAASLPAGVSYHDYFAGLSSGPARADADTATVATADGKEATKVNGRANGG